MARQGLNVPLTVQILICPSFIFWSKDKNVGQMGFKTEQTILPVVWSFGVSKKVEKTL